MCTVSALTEQQGISIQGYLRSLQCQVLVAGKQRAPLVRSQHKAYSRVFSGHDRRPGALAGGSCSRGRPGHQILVGARLWFHVRGRLLSKGWRKKMVSRSKLACSNMLRTAFSSCFAARRCSRKAPKALGPWLHVWGAVWEWSTTTPCNTNDTLH